MKSRTSFVANSSSSSFIVAYRNLDSIGENIEPNWARKMITTSIINPLRRKTPITTVEQLNDYYIGVYGYGDEDDTIETVLEENTYLRKKYPTLKKALEEGYVIVDLSIDYDDAAGSFFTGLPLADFTEPITLLANDY